MKIGLFLSGVWTSLLVGAWIYTMLEQLRDGLIISTIMLVATAFILGAIAGSETVIKN
jgi:hypothetical protein